MFISLPCFREKTLFPLLSYPNSFRFLLWYHTVHRQPSQWRNCRPTEVRRAEKIVFETAPLLSQGLYNKLSLLPYTPVCLQSGQYDRVVDRPFVRQEIENILQIVILLIVCRNSWLKLTRAGLLLSLCSIYRPLNCYSLLPVALMICLY